MSPFCSALGGGSQEICALVDVIKLASKFVGGLVGTTGKCELALTRQYHWQMVKPQESYHLVAFGIQL